MSRRRYVCRIDPETGEAKTIPVEEDYTGGGLGNHRSEAEIYGKLQASDGADISTRTRHREYMKAKGVTLAEDYKESWAKAAKERADYFTPGAKDGSSKARRESIERAMHMVANKRRG